MSRTRNPRYRRFAKVGGVALITLVVLVGAWFHFGLSPLTDRRHWPSQFQSNGERIYFTATSASDQPISSRGGGMHMRMMVGGCVDCHGSDRRGGRLMPRIWQVVPPLTSTALFGEHAGGRSEDAHGDHKVYTEETLRRAITQGIDPSGKPLDPAMPQWSMSPKDLADLIAYLKGPIAEAH